MRVFLAVISAAILANHATAVSNGHTWECDPHGNFGCSIWKNGDRMRCLEKPSGEGKRQGIMSWVKRAKHTDKYTLRAGNREPSSDATHYVPGAVMSLYISVLDFDWKYKGFFAAAVDKSGKAVGKFQFPGKSKQLFREPPLCPGRVIHNSADLKPYESQLFFKAPPAGTGPITFRALIKKGEPNMGSFHYPNRDGDLVLKEAPTVILPKLHAADPGVSCASYCAGRNEECDHAVLRSANLDSASGLAAAIAPQKVCRPPIIQSCSPVAPVLGPDGECWFYRSSKTCEADGVFAAGLTSGKPGCPAGGPGGKLDAAKTDCEAVPPPTLRRMCACKAKKVTGGGGSRRQRRNLLSSLGDSDEVASNPKDTHCSSPSSSSPCTSSAAPRQSFTLTNVVLSATLLTWLVGGGGGRGGAWSRSSGVMAVALLFALFAPQVIDAHNWLHTPSRAFKVASTTMPCRARKATDTHQQLGPGQEFVLKWATGHAQDSGLEGTTIAIIGGQHYDYLKNEDFKRIVDEYVADAPKEQANNHMDPRYQRYHGIKGGSDYTSFLDFINASSATYRADSIGFLKHVPGSQIYDGPMSRSDPNWLEHTFSGTAHQYRYRADFLKDDKRVAYANPKHPWLLAVHKYPHKYTRPGDYDSTRIKIPATWGPGHYIVHYRWKGYSDCVDVNVFDTKVDDIDGVDEGVMVWNKVDHCTYVDPKVITTQCHTATHSPDLCVKEVAKIRGNEDCGSMCKQRLGVNVVPLVAPPDVRFPDKLNLPFENGTCANTAWTLLAGNESRSRVPWAGWTAAVHKDRGCKKTMWEPRLMSLRQAVMECSSSACHAIGLVHDAHVPTGLSDAALLQRLQKDDAQHLFRGLGECYDGKGAASFTTKTGQTMLVKPKLPPNNVIGPLAKNASETWTVVFADTVSKSFSTKKKKGQYHVEHVPPSAQVIIVGRKAYRPSGGSAPAAGWKCALKSGDAFSYINSKKAAINKAFDKAKPSSRTVALNYEVGQSYLKDLHNLFCPDGTQNAIEIGLPNGVYEVTSHFGNGYDIKPDGSPVPTGGRRHYDTLCTVEGMMVADTQSKQKTSPIKIVKRVELMDGKMTISAEFGHDLLSSQRCHAITKMSFKRVAASFAPAWIPPSSDRASGGAWWQLKLSDWEANPVGLVTVVPPHKGSKGRATGFLGSALWGLEIGWKGACRLKWLFAGGGRCEEEPISDIPKIFYKGTRPRGFYYKQTEGAIVSVSNTSCSGETCPTVGERRCHWIRRVPSNASNAIFPIQVTCAGAVGQYVRVWLPGAKRIFDATVLVNRVKPLALLPDPAGGYCGAQTACPHSHGRKPCGKKGARPVCALATPGHAHAARVRGVRCCADADVTSAPPAGIKLGKQKWVKSPKCSVWANSIFPDGPVTFREAESLCSQAGARLCTIAELKKGCANDFSKSGDQQVWTSIRCKNPGGVPCVKATDPPQLVCYGVEARTHSDASTPEFIISNDPMDPVFYSTCYVRERAVSFLPPPGGSKLFSGTFQEDSNETTTVYNQLSDASTAFEWEFNGKCLDCDNYNTNLSPYSNSTPQWVLGNQESCRDCAAKAELKVQKCSAERPKPKVTTGPLVSLSPLPCNGSLVALDGASECFDAAHSLFAVSGVAVNNVTLVKDPHAPVGCSVARKAPTLVVATFNSGGVGSAKSCSPDGGAPKKATKISGRMTTKFGVSAHVEIATASGVGGAKVTLTGPDSAWFALGFHASSMYDQPYTVVVEGGAVVSEWEIGNHEKGTKLVEKGGARVDLTLLGSRTLIPPNSSATMREVTFELPRDGKHVSFNSEQRRLSLIVAVGSTSTLSFHPSSAHKVVVLQPNVEDACMCRDAPTTTAASTTTTTTTSSVDTSSTTSSVDTSSTTSSVDTSSTTSSVDTSSTTSSVDASSSTTTSSVDASTIASSADASTTTSPSAPATSLANVTKAKKDDGTDAAGTTTTTTSNENIDVIASEGNTIGVVASIAAAVVVTLMVTMNGI